MKPWIAVPFLAPLGPVAGGDPGGSLEATLAALRECEDVEGKHVGKGGGTGDFFLRSLECIRLGSRRGFEGMLEDPSPVVRAMGLVGFAQRPDFPDRVAVLKRFLEDPQRVVVREMGCVGFHFSIAEFSRNLLRNANYLGHGDPAYARQPLLSEEDLACLDLEILASDRWSVVDPLWVLGELLRSVGAGDVAHEPGRVRSPCERLSPVQVVKAVGRLSGPGPTRDFLVACLGDDLLPDEARFAAASALAGDFEEGAFDTLAVAEGLLSATAVGQTILRRRWDQIRYREDLRASLAAEDPDEAAEFAAWAFRSEPWLFDVLAEEFRRGAEKAPSALRRGVARAFLGMSYRLEEVAAVWDADGDVPFRMRRGLRETWGRDLLRHLDDPEREALLENLERFTRSRP